MPATDYMVGRGRVYFHETGTNGLLFLGNAPDFRSSIEVEKLAHFSSMSGVREKDREIVIQQTFTSNFMLDEPVAKNLALFFHASDPTQTVVAPASVVDEAATAYTGKWIKLANYNIDPLTDVVTGTGGTPTYVRGTDYNIYNEQGLIENLAIPDATVLEIDYDHLGVTKNQVDIGTRSTRTGILYFFGDPGAGRILDIVGKVSLSAEGELPFISEEWSSFNFIAEYLDDGTFTGAGYVIDRGYVSV